MTEAETMSESGGEEGQSLIEFALLLPIFLLLVVGIAEFGRAWMTRNVLTGAAQEAARAASVEPNHAMAYSAAAAVANPILASANIPRTLQAGDFDDTVNSPVPIVTVHITYNYPLLIAGFIPGLAGPTVPLTGSATMRRERY